MSNHFSHSVQFLGQSIIQNLDKLTANARHLNNISSNKEQSLPDVVPVSFYDHLFTSLGGSIEAGELSYPHEDLPGIEGKQTATGLLESLMMSISSVKQTLFSYIDENSQYLSLTVSDVIAVSKLIDPLMNYYQQHYTEQYMQQETIRLQAEYYQEDELSVPIIKISTNVAICPIIGEIDERRANLILERTLIESSAKKIRSLILDLSGVATLDTMMTQHLFKIVDSLEMMGVDVIVTGVSSEIAIGVVSLGLDLQALTIKQDLEGALKSLGMIDS
ncbi:STAS domain-containing protein [Pseudalkalibacillus hwajinpoensis]|uniref:STAS domain-containing protein n=1 Tax=Guptibacillus hwajinpoensis TaxID=208199 RepID=UPI00325B7E5B